MLAQEPVNIDALLGDYLPVLAILVPIILSIGVKYTSPKKFKQGMAVVGAGAVVGLSLFTDPVADLTWPVVTARLTSAIVLAETSYRTLNLFLAPFKAGGLNEIFDLGGAGVGPADPELSRS